MCIKSSDKFAVIGHPIGHTMSPFIHSRLFHLSGKAAPEYQSMDIAPEDLADSMSRLKQLRGFNITIPHKQAILPLLDACSPQAAAFGSVNTVSMENGIATGYTTDGIGCLKALEAAGISPKGRCLLLGSGGAARAIAFAFTEVCDTPDLTFAVREESLEKTRELCASLALYAEKLGKTGKNTAIPYSLLESRTEACLNKLSYDLLLNCTSVGMYPHIDRCAVSETVISRCGAVFDAVYNPHDTLLLKTARKLGIPVVHGMAMLVWQAAAAHEIWYGVSFRPEDMAKLTQEAAEEMERRFREEAK